MKQDKILPLEKDSSFCVVMDKNSPMTKDVREENSAICDRHGVHVPRAQRPKEESEGECVSSSQTKERQIINKSI